MNSLSSDLYPEVRLLCHFYLFYEPLVLSIMSEPLSTPSHPTASTISNPSDNSHSDFHFSDNQRSSALFSNARCSHECLLLRNVSSDLLPALHQTIATAVAATDTEFLVFLQMLDTALSRSRCYKPFPTSSGSSAHPAGSQTKNDTLWFDQSWYFFYFYLSFLWSEGPAQKLANVLICFCALSGSSISKFGGIFKACHVSQPNDVLGSVKSS